MRILVIGGYGTFGGRLVDLLLDEPRLTLVVAGRSLAKGLDFIKARVGSAATLEATALDRNDPGQAILDQRPDIVVDATGPFQGYGDDPYRVVRAAITAGASWLDLADAAAFVTGITALDDRAREAGVFVLSGVSSFPVLSAAVADCLAEGMTKVHSISGGIAPSPYAKVGFNVIDAIASYAGKQIPVTKGSKETAAHGMIDSRYFTVAVPGTVPLPRTRFALVEVPDLQVLAERHSGVSDVWIGAGPTPAVLHRLLWCMAHLVKWGVMPSLRPMAPIMDWVVNTVRWGEHRGGMWIELVGEDDNGAVRKSWHLLAEGDMGPFIPSMACEIIIRNCLEGRVPAPGARPASGSVNLAEYDLMFVRRGIVSGIRSCHEGRQVMPYRKVMAHAFAHLDEPLRRVHSFADSARHIGVAKVTGANNAIAGLISRIMRFPKAGDAVPLAVDMTRDGDIETWTRTYAGVPFRSQVAAGLDDTRTEGLLTERIGPLFFGMAVVERDGAISLVMRNWSAFGIPMPKFALPKVTAIEHGDEGRFNFSVEISLPVVGRLVRYDGWMRQVDGTSGSETP